MSDVHTQDAPERMARQRSDKPGVYIWYELMTTDPAGAKRFYDAVVSGWNIATDSVAPHGMDYRMINRSDEKMAGGVFGLTQEHLDGGARPIWIGYLHTTDVDAEVEAIGANGGQILQGPMENPGGEYSVNGIDPQGATFGLVGPKK